MKIITSNHTYNFSYRNFRATISCFFATVVRKTVDSFLKKVSKIGQWANEKLNERGV